MIAIQMHTHTVADDEIDAMKENDTVHGKSRIWKSVLCVSVVWERCRKQWSKLHLSAGSVVISFQYMHTLGLLPSSNGWYEQEPNEYQCYAQKNALAHPSTRKTQSMNTIALTERYPCTSKRTHTHTHTCKRYIQPFRRRKKKKSKSDWTTTKNTHHFVF